MADRRFVLVNAYSYCGAHNSAMAPIRRCRFSFSASFEHADARLTVLLFADDGRLPHDRCMLHSSCSKSVPLRCREKDLGHSVLADPRSSESVLVASSFVELAFSSRPHVHSSAFSRDGWCAE